MVQPPTFVGDSGVGYVVTAEGDLVRFNLQDPSAGAVVVFSGGQVLAAQALSSGQVVVALADGDVSLLDPVGRRPDGGLGARGRRGASPPCPARSTW